MLIQLETNPLTEKIIGCAIEVQRQLGPGLLESVYESALCIEFKRAGLRYVRQVGIPVTYKGELIGEHRPDLIVEDTVVVEIKRVERMEPVHIAQMVTYLRITELKVGLIINFNCATLRSGIRGVLR
jgi:GxxExxY protein